MTDQRIIQCRPRLYVPESGSMPFAEIRLPSGSVIFEVTMRAWLKLLDWPDDTDHCLKCANCAMAELRGFPAFPECCGACLSRNPHLCATCSEQQYFQRCTEPQPDYSCPSPPNFASPFTPGERRAA